MLLSTYPLNLSHCEGKTFRKLGLVLRVEECEIRLEECFQRIKSMSKEEATVIGRRSSNQESQIIQHINMKRLRKRCLGE